LNPSPKARNDLDNIFQGVSDEHAIPGDEPKQEDEILRRMLEYVTGRTVDSFTIQVFKLKCGEVVPRSNLRVSEYKYRFFFGLDVHQSLSQIEQGLHATEHDKTKTVELRTLAAVYRVIPSLRVPTSSMEPKQALLNLGHFVKEHFAVADGDVCSWLSKLAPFSDTHVRNLVRDRHPEWLSSYRQENGRKASSRTSSAEMSRKETSGSSKRPITDIPLDELCFLDSEYVVAINMASEKLGRDPYVLFHGFLLDGLVRESIK
jgi:hypothetical protein